MRGSWHPLSGRWAMQSLRSSLGWRARSKVMCSLPAGRALRGRRRSGRQPPHAQWVLDLWWKIPPLISGPGSVLSLSTASGRTSWHDAGSLRDCSTTRPRLRHGRRSEHKAARVRQQSSSVRGAKQTQRDANCAAGQGPRGATRRPQAAGEGGQEAGGELGILVGTGPVLAHVAPDGRPPTGLLRQVISSSMDLLEAKGAVSEWMSAPVAVARRHRPARRCQARRGSRARGGL